jgi:hypothetical protein
MNQSTSNDHGLTLTVSSNLCDTVANDITILRIRRDNDTARRNRGFYIFDSK